MDRYHIWFDLRPGVKDLEAARSIQDMMGRMQKDGLVEGFELERRKLGFGPKELGEWHVCVRVKDMAQLEAAFDELTPRTGELERLHAAVWSKVTNFRSALYRDFPDPNRIRPPEKAHHGDEVA